MPDRLLVPLDSNFAVIFVINLNSQLTLYYVYDWRDIINDNVEYRLKRI